MQTSRIYVTEVIDFDECRRRWYWSWVQGWTSKQPPLDRWLGEGIHIALDHYYWNGRDANIAVAHFDDWYAKFGDEQKKYGEFLWELVEESFRPMYELGRGMIGNYAYWDEQDTTLYGDVLAVEASLQAQPRPTGREKIFPTLRGRVDLVLKRSDGIWVIDHKSHKTRPSWNGLENDDQLTAYCYLFWRSTGIIPRGVIYNALLKRLPEEPRRLKDGSLSRDKSQAVTYDTYLQQIEAIGDDPKKYTDMLTYLAQKGWSDFFAREGSTRNVEELQAYERRTAVKYREMLAAKADPRRLVYPAPTMFKCGYCAFQAPCKSMDDGGDYEAQLESLFFQPKHES